VDEFIRSFLGSYFRTLFYFVCAIAVSLMYAAAVLVWVAFGMALWADRGWLSLVLQSWLSLWR
jgi:hypothetical protein